MASRSVTSAIAGEGPGRAPSLRLRLLILVGLLTAGFLGLAAYSVSRAYDAARSRAADQMLGTARVLATLVDQEFARAEALLLGIATSPEVARGDVGAFVAAARSLDRLLGQQVVALVEAPGLQVANSLRGVLTEPMPLTGGLEQVFTTHKLTVSEFYRGQLTGAPAVAIAVPVPPQLGGPPQFALRMALHRGEFSGVLRRLELPAGTIASVHDRSGTIVARSRQEAETVGRAPPAVLVQAMSGAESGIVERMTMLGGGSAAAAFARAPRSGFTAVIAMPDAAFATDRDRALAWLAVSAAPIAVAGMALTLLLAFRLRQALAGVPGGAGRYRLAEVEELKAALDESDHARSATESALRDRNTWLEQTQLAAAMGVWERDLSGDTLLWSEGLYRLFGLEMPATPVMSRASLLALLVEEDRPRLGLATQEALRTGVYQAEFRVRRADGAIRWLRAQGVLERGPDGTPRRILGANLDITERRQLEDEREKLLAEKDLLAAEIHHRVKNSLQLVQGLLLMQARHAGAELAGQLRDAAARVVSIAAVHRRLYEGSSLPSQDAAGHLAALVEDLRRSLASQGRPLLLQAAPGVLLAPERMAALGLLVTELATNAFKYGAGSVVVRLRSEGPPGEAQAVVEVEDEGGGFPAGFDAGKSRGLGMRVALAMARQLRGTLKVGPGTVVVARFPIRPPSPSRAGPASSR